MSNQVRPLQEVVSAGASMLVRNFSHRWDATIRDCTLGTVMEALYAFEINCGVSSFWDGGWTAWIGDEMNGRLAEAGFLPGDFHMIAPWLADNAERLYPLLRKAA